MFMPGLPQIQVQQSSGKRSTFDNQKQLIRQPFHCPCIRDSEFQKRISAPLNWISLVSILSIGSLRRSGLTMM